ncbi:MAG: 7TM domain-containing protein [Candidatus Shapirobacteria bacterium]
MNFSFYFLREGVVLARASGLSDSVIAAFLLLPLAAAFIAAARYLLGLRGLGVFTPIMLSVVFLMIGLPTGLSLFFLILLAATFARLIMRRLKIHYLARMALVIWFVSLVVFLFAAAFDFQILPLMILVLLAEDLVEAQISQSSSRALRSTLEVLILSSACFATFSWPFLQNLALAQPELLLFTTLVLNLLIGRFAGLRLLEYQRFRRLLK